jgi:hypothetical protein
VVPERSERSVIKNQGSFAGTHFPDEPIYNNFIKDLTADPCDNACKKAFLRFFALMLLFVK